MKASAFGCAAPVLRTTGAALFLAFHRLSAHFTQLFREILYRRKNQFFLTNNLLLKEAPGLEVKQISPGGLINNIVATPMAFYRIVAKRMFQRVTDQTAGLFQAVSWFYRGKTYIQDEAETRPL